jgi:hypothetical protein
MVFLLYTSYKYSRKRKKQKMLEELRGKPLEVFQVLEEQGYKLVDYNCSRSIAAEVNNRVYTHTFHSLMIVKKGKYKYIVYIKKGKDPLRLSTKKVREHFLTLCTFFKVAGVLIIDAEKLNIRSLEFKFKM